MNLGFNGAKTRDILQQIESAIGQKFVLTSDISRVLDKAKETSSKVILFRGGNVGGFPIFPFFLAQLYTWRSRQVRELFKKIAIEKGVVYIEKFMERNDDIFLKNPQVYYWRERIHLNGRGYKIWFDYLVER